MSHYNLIFQGKIVEGASLDEVKNNVARLFKADAKKTASLFSGKPIIIKKNLDSETTRKYLAILKKAGAVIQAVKIESTSVSKTPETKSPEAETNNNKPNNSSSSGKLSAGLASLTNYNNFQKKVSPKATNSEDNTVQEEGLQLVPLGSALPAQTKKNEAAEIPNTDHIILFEAESGSLEEFAKKAEAIELPDIDSLTMSEANTGSMEEFTKETEPAELPDISKLKVSEQDETPLSEGAPKPTPIEVPDTSDISMSDAQDGTLEGVEIKPEPAEIPDTSHIKMEETEEPDHKKEKITGKASFQIN
ncbi:MAG: hypothetical protein GY694_17565 [Gammaproteobacteria bacterium]|nr:hypothetical protein [Gammaproteobacteria bacterium]